MKRVVLLTSGQPSLNPRLIKEADTLSDAGYNVTVLYQYWNQWGTDADRLLLPSKKWKAIRVGGSPEYSIAIVYHLSRVIQKTANLLKNIFGLNALLGELSISRCSLFLYLEAIKHPADLYIGHNLGALGPTAIAARYHKKPFGFDAEDFHRNEISNDDNHSDVKLKKYLEEKYFPRLTYLSTASPLISDEYKRLFPRIQISTILNVFPSSDIKIPGAKNKNTPLKLFWFSQTIGRDRGLEQVLDIVEEMQDHRIELHLLGDLKEKEYFKKAGIFIYSPIPSDKIVSFASQFDIGLALETGIPYNRDICLTNKIFTYIQAGLAVVATDTKAQQELLGNYPEIGNSYDKLDKAGLKRILQTYLVEPELLLSHKKNAFLLGKNTLNWEIEKYKFMNITTKIV